jgi:hypothetical protein
MFRVFLEGKHRAEARHVLLSPFNALHRWRCSSMHKLGLHLTDCQRIPSYFPREMPSLLDPAVAGEEAPPPSSPPPPPTAYRQPAPNTARLRVRYLTTRVLTRRRSADRWLLQLARSGTHVWRSTSNQADSRTRGLRVRAWGVGFDLLQVPPNPIPCHRYHE